MNALNRGIARALALLLSTSFCSLSVAQGAGEVSKETSRAEVEQCVAQHDSARQLRLGEQWLGARAAMLGCADERCPLAIAADCRAWLDELARLMPTLIIVVEGEEPPARQALRVELDGQSVELKDPPSPIDLLPGAHRLRFALAGAQPVDREFRLEKGEKNHIERLRFMRASAGESPPPSGTRVPTRPVPAATYWLSAAALAAFAGSAVLLVSGLKEHEDARAICAPNCDDDVRTSIQARLLLGDAAAGAGLVLGGLAVYSYLRRPIVLKEVRRSGPTVSASSQGILFSWRGQF